MASKGNPSHDSAGAVDPKFKILGRVNTLKYIDGEFIDPTMVDKVISEGIKWFIKFLLLLKYYS